MIGQKRIQDAYLLIQRFYNAMKFTNDSNGLIWYHALCMDMLLDTSLTIIPYETCDQFYMSVLTTRSNDGAHEALARFFANLLLWNIRHNIQEMAHMWMNQLETCFSIEVESSFNNMFTGLRVMEALTIQLSLSIADRNLTLFEHYDNEMLKIIKVMRLALKCNKYVVERFELHRIHFELVKKFDMKHLKKLGKLMDKALKSKNYCAYDIIKHSGRSWENKLISDHFWINQSTCYNQINLNKFISKTDRIFPFSLPIPKSGNF